MLFEVAVQTAIMHIFHDQNHILGGLNDLKQPGNLQIVHLLHELDLALDRLLAVDVGQFGLAVDLHCHLLVARNVDCSSDNGIRALAYLFADNVIFQAGFFTEDYFVLFFLRLFGWGLLGVVAWGRHLFRITSKRLKHKRICVPLPFPFSILFEQIKPTRTFLHPFGCQGLH